MEGGLGVERHSLTSLVVCGLPTRTWLDQHCYFSRKWSTIPQLSSHITWRRLPIFIAYELDLHSMMNGQFSRNLS